MSKRRVLASSLAAGVFVLAGCSTNMGAPKAAPSSVASGMPSGMASGMPSAPAGASSSDPVCAAEANLKTSINDLKSLRTSGGISGVQKAVNDISTNVTALKTAAQGQFEPQIDGLTSSLSELKTSLGTLTSSPGASSIAGVVSSVTGVVTAFNTLDGAVSARCPG